VTDKFSVNETTRAEMRKLEIS